MTLENPLKRARMQPRQAGQLPCRSRLVGLRLHEAADPTHALHLAQPFGWLLRLAALAGAEARLLRHVGFVEERHHLGSRPPRRTPRPAVDPRAAHAEHEDSLPRRIAIDDRLPARIGLHGRPSCIARGLAFRRTRLCLLRCWGLSHYGFLLAHSFSPLVRRSLSGSRRRIRVRSTRPPSSRARSSPRPARSHSC